MLLSEAKNQLKILQKEKQSIITNIKIKYEYDKKLIELDNEIEKLNSLNLDVNELSKLKIKVQTSKKNYFLKLKMKF